MVVNDSKVVNIFKAIRNNSNTNSVAFGYFLFIVFIIQKYVAYLSDYTVILSWFLILLIPFAYDLKSIKPIGLMLPCTLVLYIFNKDIISIYFLFSFVYILRNQPIHRLAAIILFLNVLFFIIVFLLVSNGVIVDIVKTSSKGISHDMGFGNSNSFGLFGYYSLIALYIVLFNKNKFLTYVLLISLNELLFYYSCSRTSWFSGIVLISCDILYNIGVFKNWTKYIVAIIPIFFTIIVYYILFNADKFGALNILLSKRISILSECLSEIRGVKIFTGSVFEGEPIDCAYVGSLFSGGIFFLLFFLISYANCVIKEYDTIRYYLPVLISVVISGIGENTFCSPMPSIVLFWLILLTKSPIVKSKYFKIEYVCSTSYSQNYSKAYN